MKPSSATPWRSEDVPLGLGAAICAEWKRVDPQGYAAHLLKEQRSETTRSEIVGPVDEEATIKSLLSIVAYDMHGAAEKDLRALLYRTSCAGYAKGRSDGFDAARSARAKFIRCVWVAEREFGYGKALRIEDSDHPRFTIGTRFDFGFLNIAVSEGYQIQIEPVPPAVQHDIEEARRERQAARR